MPIDPETAELLEAFKVATNSALLEAQKSAEELKDLIEAAEKAKVMVHLDFDPIFIWIVAKHISSWNVTGNPAKNRHQGHQTGTQISCLQESSEFQPFNSLD